MSDTPFRLSPGETFSTDKPRVTFVIDDETIIPAGYRITLVVTTADRRESLATGLQLIGEPIEDR